MPQDFATIKDAIAQASHGDEIVVGPGEYYENLDFHGKSLVLRSTDGADSTLIGGGQHEIGDKLQGCIYLDAIPRRGALVRGFTFEDGDGTRYLASSGLEFFKGGGIYVRGSRLRIEACRFRDNAGSAVAAIDSEVTIVDSSFVDNVSYTFGGAVDAFGTGTLEIRGCLFEDNLGEILGGAISVGSKGITASIIDCEFARNETYFVGGGAIDSGAGSLYVVDCTFREHDSWLGGVVIDNGDATHFERCTFLDNRASVGAAILYGSEAPGATLRLSHCVFAWNSALDHGSVLAAGSDADCEFTHCTMYGNGSARASLVARVASPSSPGLEGNFSFRSCIAWRNSETLFEVSLGDAWVDYSAIEGGFDGRGNIEDDPRFVDAEGGDFRLLGDSPCIDAGDPAAPPDSDQSRADMGAFATLLRGFRRGDVNYDGSVFAFADSARLFAWAFADGQAPPCMDAADCNDDGVVSPLGDGVALLLWVLATGPPPAAPGPVTCGLDPTDDDSLGCAALADCD